MSNARKMNLAISRYLKQILAGHVQDSHIYALALLMTGLIRSKSANFEEMGRKSGHGSGSKSPSRVKRIHRFIKNKHISYESHFLPFIELVIASLALDEFRLSLDSSKVDRGCLILVIGLVYKQRVIPLAWLVYKGVKGHSRVEKQLKLLNQVLALLPKGAKVILTGDAEFDGTGVIEWLQPQPDWYHALRTAKNIIVQVANEPLGQALEALSPPPGQDKFLVGVLFTQQQVGPVNIAILWHEANQEHLYLVTDAQTLEQAHSLFQLGRAYLDRILEENWAIPVSFNLPDPRSFVHLVLV